MIASFFLLRKRLSEQKELLKTSKRQKIDRVTPIKLFYIVEDEQKLASIASNGLACEPSEIEDENIYCMSF
jgi:hypothetical protein